MSAQTDARRPTDRTHRRRRGGLLDGGLSRLGTDGEGNLARALSHPLSDYYLVLANWKNRKQPPDTTDAIDGSARRE